MSEIETTIEAIETSEDYGRFVIEPLEQGFGTTLGNSMRRVLLGSLPGTSVTTVKVESVYHEFTGIPHIKEDVTEFLLNVKQIRLRSFSDRPVKMRLEVSGEGQVTAGDITTTPDVEVVNPELHLATLDSPEARLVVEFGVEQGKGYVPAGHRAELPIGTMPVDAIFTPMRKVSYVIEPTRVRERTDLERLVLELWTDGTITPRQAVSQASRILTDHLRLFLDLDRQPARSDRRGLSAVPISARDYERSIEELDLSVRAYNCLKRSGITKIGQILEMSDEELLAVRNFGQKSLDELKERLAQRGFVLRPSSEEGIPKEFGSEDEDEDELAEEDLTLLGPDGTFHFEPGGEDLDDDLAAPSSLEENENET
ncbi:MAG: DNA-directed RNA polymerase subunit alpha [Dehalococcoidia bacterium]|nr:DNA-directed RNA polymerase subunit alpha [Dehalococcoidia bacterium]